MKKTELVPIAEELNDLLGLTPAIDTKLGIKALSQEMALKAIGWIDSSDLEGDEKISDEAIKIAKELCVMHYDLILEKRDSKKKEEQEYVDRLVETGFLTIEEVEPPEETEPDEVPASQIYIEVEDAETLKALKILARANKEFSEKKADLSKIKDVEDLREAMLDILDDVDATPKKAPKAAAKPKADKPKADKPAAKKGDTLASFVDETVQAGGDWKTILELCNADAEKRGATTVFTKATVRAHVKYRLATKPEYLGKLELTDSGIE